MNHEHTAPLPGPASGPLPNSLGLGLPTRMRGPSDMAEMLPYLLGFFPDDSIVVVGLHGPRLEQGGVIRLDIPDNQETWPSVAADTARLLVELSEQRGRRPDQVLVYLCHDPADGDCPATISRLAPLADGLTDAFRAQGVKVRESLGIADGRWWSFLCRGTTCCGPAGTPIRSARVPSAIAAAATFAGLAPRGSRKEITAGLVPVGPTDAERYLAELHRAGPELIGLLSRPSERSALVERTSGLIDAAMEKFRAGAEELDAEHTARLLTGLQVRECRDRGAEYLEPEELVTAQRLWRYLARRAVPPFESFGAAPLTLLAWTSWLADDTATARIVLSRALDLDGDYTLAQLLYESLNAGLRPDDLLDGIRQERAARRSRGEAGTGHPGATAVPEAIDRASPYGPVDGGPGAEGPGPDGPDSGSVGSGPEPPARPGVQRGADAARIRTGGRSGAEPGADARSGPRPAGARAAVAPARGRATPGAAGPSPSDSPAAGAAGEPPAPRRGWSRLVRRSACPSTVGHGDRGEAAGPEARAGSVPRPRSRPRWTG
ncbi:DUF4192 domain-containing protein [Kitasatospora sp. NPDC002227]|uniref:DUF4192 domain-containing protein n=1 Tax=Kitasatospora sp. NPDC002227 TaxID=3154773 RepID=UPI00332CC3ED